MLLWNLLPVNYCMKPLVLKPCIKCSTGTSGALCAVAEACKNPASINQTLANYLHKVYYVLMHLPSNSYWLYKAILPDIT